MSHKVEILCQGDYTFGGKNCREIKRVLKQNEIRVDSQTKSKIDHFDPEMLKTIKTAHFVQVRIGNIISRPNPTTKEICQEATVYNLYPNSPDSIAIPDLYNLAVGKHKHLVTETRLDSSCNLIVFGLGRSVIGGLWLSDDQVGPNSRWSPDDEMVFRLCKQLPLPSATKK